MTKDQIKVGQRIRQTAHPEYGDWVIRRHYSSTTWEVGRYRHGKYDEIAVCEGELTKFWDIIK